MVTESLIAAQAFLQDQGVADADSLSPQETIAAMAKFENAYAEVIRALTYLGEAKLALARLERPNLSPAHCELHRNPKELFQWKETHRIVSTVVAMLRAEYVGGLS